MKIRLTKKQARDLLSTFDSAQRGRDDFEYLAGLDAGDYSKGDVKRARKWHMREIAVEALLREEIEDRLHPNHIQCADGCGLGVAHTGGCRRKPGGYVICGRSEHDYPEGA